MNANLTTVVPQNATPRRRPGRPARTAEGGLVRCIITLERRTDTLLREMAGAVPLTRYVEKLILDEAKRAGLIE